MSLKLRLGIGAAVLTLAAVVSAIFLYLGMIEIAKRLDTALASEKRMARYSTLSTQVSTFLVIATESVQTGLSPQRRKERITPVAEKIEEAFVGLRADLETAVTAAEALGIDQQSRYGTQSLGLARMEAQLGGTLKGLFSDSTDQARLKAYLDSFASSFDPLLNQAVNSELLFRNGILNSIQTLRHRLAQSAVILAIAAIIGAMAFYFGLIRPQFQRLDRLRDAARQIGQEDFTVSLPETQQDEIGALYDETRRMAQSLSLRQAEVRSEWARLNETIDQRTQELRSANEKLTEIDNNRRRFFADVSHELRTPLTVILMEAQIGRQGAGDAAESFGTIEQRAERLNRRIDDLLRVARSDSGQLALDPQMITLDALITAVIEECAAEIDNAGMTLVHDPVPDETLLCDPNWIRQILVGLIRNAIRHARDGQHLSLGVSVDDGTVDLRITDNGPGIAQQDQDQIFDRFVQSSGAKSQGFGIGLALVKWVAEAHQGNVAVQSPVSRDIALGENAGTMIVVQLPR